MDRVETFFTVLIQCENKPECSICGFEASVVVPYGSEK